jgi:hypothetical protein
MFSNQLVDAVEIEPTTCRLRVGFTKCAAGILSRLFPELSHQALLQIP